MPSQGRLGDKSDESVLLFSLKNWSLEGMLESANDIIEAGTKIRPIPTAVLGLFATAFDFEDVNFGIAGKPIEFDGYKYPKGMTFDAKILPPRMRVPIRITALLDDDGIKASGSTKTINLGVLKINGLGRDKIPNTPDDGPVVAINLLNRLAKLKKILTLSSKVNSRAIFMPK